MFLSQTLTLTLTKTLTLTFRLEQAWKKIRERAMVLARKIRLALFNDTLRVDVAFCVILRRLSRAAPSTLPRVRAAIDIPVHERIFHSASFHFIYASMGMWRDSRRAEDPAHWIIFCRDLSGWIMLRGRPQA